MLHFSLYANILYFPMRHFSSWTIRLAAKSLKLFLQVHWVL